MFPNIDIRETILTIPAILIAFTFHEYAHAYMATRFGDPTPGRQGRLTANPLAHIDPWGFILILLFRFGWAKPVQTNPSNYRGNVRQKDLLVSLAGPVTNLIIAVAAGLICILLIRSGFLRSIGGNSASIILEIMENVIYINCILFIFNLVPIPPLDGFHILSDLLPSSAYRFIYTVERYGFIILMIFIVSPLSNIIVGNGGNYLFYNLLRILGLI